MESYIVYRSERRRSLDLAFAPDEEFREIVDLFGQIAYPSLPLNPELVSFAILELVSNSIRAHREKGVEEKVKVVLVSDGGRLTVTIQDSGRGFDPGRLPYDLDAPVSSVDIMGEEFAAYRERYGGSRFGMGLYMAKKTFDSFSLRFVDSAGRSCPWYSGMVKGTRIDLSLPLKPEEQEADDLESLAEEVETLEEAGI